MFLVRCEPFDHDQRGHPSHPIVSCLKWPCHRVFLRSGPGKNTKTEPCPSLDLIRYRFLTDSQQMTSRDELTPRQSKCVLAALL